MRGRFQPCPLQRRPSDVATSTSPRPWQLPGQSVSGSAADLDRLVSRARAGDQDAFRALYQRTVGRVYAACLRLTADPALAEELTQDVFVRVWRRLDTFRGDSAFTTWLHRVAVNQVCSDRRAEGRRARRTAMLGLDRPEHAAPLPDQAIDLEHAIASLPPGARQAFVLHDVEGYSHEEIARMNGRTPGTIKAQLFRARRLLREWLER